jgi:hypothetical protein
MRFRFACVLKRYPSSAATWYVVTIGEPVAEKIHRRYHGRHGGFRSLPVSVTIGSTTWRTALFYDSGAKSYLLFIKASVRRLEGLVPGEQLCGTGVIVDTFSRREIVSGSTQK